MAFHVVAEPVPPSVQEIASGSFIQTVYVDPSDPSYVYTSQPYQPATALPANYPIPVYYSAPQTPVYAQPAQPAQPV